MATQPQTTAIMIMVLVESPPFPPSSRPKTRNLELVGVPCMWYTRGDGGKERRGKESGSVGAQDDEGARDALESYKKTALSAL